MERFNHLIKRAVDQGFSDVHLTGGHPIVYRRHGRIHFDNNVVFGHEEIDALVKSLLGPREMQMLQSRYSVDLAKTVHQTRLRLNVFSTTRGLSIAIRMLPGSAPTVENLNLHASLKNFCSRSEGLILVCGTTGSGKSSTMAAMIEEINRTRSCHIVSIEDPIEFRYLSKQSFIEQRELSTHVPTFEQGLRDVLREDPDVIVVGELREPRTMRLTLDAAESGHLVIASMHASNSEDAVHRICNSFKEDAQEIVRSQLSSTLVIVMVQRLVYRKDLGYRIPIMSLLVGTPAVRGLIRENRLTQLENTIVTGRKDGMFTMNQYEFEILPRKGHFNNPAINLSPVGEASREKDYRSPILEADLAIGATAKNQTSSDSSWLSVATPSVSKTTAPAPPQPSAAQSSHYVIAEEQPMDELIAEISQSYPKKPPHQRA